VPDVLSFKRVHETHLFFDETATVTLEVRNSSVIPIPWLQYSERLPLRLGYTSPHTGAAYIPAHGLQKLRYTVRGSRRGLYALGPLTLNYGDIFGFEDRILRGAGTDQLIVYPKIVPLEQLLLPSRSPLGALRSRNPLSEDPSRVIGVRDYQRGDSIRRIHWPATARHGQLQVKKLEPAMTLQTILLLDLHPESYDSQLVDQYQELAIVAAASFANRLIEMRQAVGLISNGVDVAMRGAGDEEVRSAVLPRSPDLPISSSPAPLIVPAGRGRGHAIRLLEALARIETSNHMPLPILLQQHAHGLGWGTTAVVITGGITTALAPSLAGLKRNGYTVLLLLAGGRRAVTEAAIPATVPLYRIREERDLPAVAEVFHG
ncbi:MAG TPA: DUF58 domain-containing protein, partial [Chloroflexota bacterium]|nr:DUF58 domain-containing protein [Chloroflexota bacterium]